MNINFANLTRQYLEYKDEIDSKIQEVLIPQIILWEHKFMILKKN